ncbi:hypothetical protein [Chitinophaga qingshengii]|uniref:DUF4136 domain-containing protein n=1 Tax=Chitinophaga qingshengii TaxID=1569794 RepID=A0ABR7TS08_9BACT|nr:hypothetical protein [Chitinophaga qingshengii]MBC9933274.1 hypothetical protein [Chitinophaga qingshengii]
MHTLSVSFGRRFGAYMALLAMTLLAAACGTTVHMTGTWKDPEAGTGYHNILVAGLSSNATARGTVENKLAAQLQQHGVVAGKSTDLFPPNFDPKKEESVKSASGKIEAAGYKAVLTVSLVNKESETRYVPGTMYAPYPAYGWYGRFWGYYGYMWNSVYSPGYYTTDKVYFLESNLYDLTKDGKLVWSGQSETYNPNSLESFATAYAKKVTDALEKSGLLQR